MRTRTYLAIAAAVFLGLALAWLGALAIAGGPRAKRTIGVTR